jgi:hypothetical protein
MDLARSFLTLMKYFLMEWLEAIHLISHLGMQKHLMTHKELLNY